MKVLHFDAVVIFPLLLPIIFEKKLENKRGRLAIEAYSLTWANKTQKRDLWYHHRILRIIIRWVSLAQSRVEIINWLSEFANHLSII